MKALCPVVSYCITSPNTYLSSQCSARHTVLQEEVLDPGEAELGAVQEEESENNHSQTTCSTMPTAHR